MIYRRIDRGNWNTVSWESGGSGNGRNVLRIFSRKVWNIRRVRC